jgi:hypothetical protein
MKKPTQSLLLFLCLLIALFYFSGCKKDGNRVNITLHNKPLSTIQSYIKGKWKLEYEKGGICWNCTNYIDNFYWTFGSNNKVQQTYNDTLITETSIVWKWDKPANTDYTYIMNFSDKRGYPYFYNVYEIKNDTLILTDAGYDPVAYYFTKSK